ncbi:MAG: glycosyltransferase family 10 domain-containing protein [Candidatus Promineifilaceae bacterium]
MTTAQQPTVLFWNDFAKQKIPLRFEWACGSDCILTADHRLRRRADAVVVHVAKLKTRREIGTVIAQILTKPRGQKWVAWSRESGTNYPLLHNRRFMNLFDATLTYWREATFWDPYVTAPEIHEMFTNPLLPKTEEKPTALFVSGRANQSGRREVIKELMAHLPVDSYGKLYHNRMLPKDDWLPTKLATIARYKFTIAFENSIERDYVTEKIFQPWRMGSVPIYLGAPNIDEYAPGPHSFINVKDYTSVAELAEYLSYLCEDEAAYNAYFDWKQGTLQSPLLQKIVDEEIQGYEKFCTMLCSGAF